MTQLGGQGAEHLLLGGFILAAADLLERLAHTQEPLRRLSQKRLEGVNCKEGSVLTWLLGDSRLQTALGRRRWRWQRHRSRAHAESSQKLRNRFFLCEGPSRALDHDGWERRPRIGVPGQALSNLGRKPPAGENKAKEQRQPKSDI